MWLMLQQDTPEDYVIGTGEAHTVREFVEAAFSHAGLDWREYVVDRPRYSAPQRLITCSPTRQGPSEVGLGADGDVSGAGPNHGRRGSG